MDYKYFSIGHKSRFLDSCFVLDKQATVTSQTDIIVPDCTPGVMYVEQGQFSRKSDLGEMTFQEGKFYLFGQKSKSVKYIFDQESIRASGVKLSPLAIYAVFGISAHEVTDKVIELDDHLISKDKLIKLLQLNLDEDSLIQPQKEVPKLLEELLSEIHRQKGMLAISRLANEFNLSYKYLQRLFKRHIGVTPKLYARIIRFNYSIKVGVNRKYNLTDVAYESGFFDQNHFIKEVKNFSNLIPSEVYDLSESKLELNHVNYLLDRSF